MRFSRGFSVLVFLFLWVAYALATFPMWERIVTRAGLRVPMRPFSANDQSNFATIQALVERHTWAIAQKSADGGRNGDRHPRSLRIAPGNASEDKVPVPLSSDGRRIDHTIFNTTDEALIDGRYYSVRPPVLPFLASGVYWVLHEVFGLRFRDGPTATSWILWALVVSVSGFCAALMAVCVGRSVELGRDRATGASGGNGSLSAIDHFITGGRAGRPTPAGPSTGETPVPPGGSARGLTAALLLGLGSLALPYATVFNHHIVAAGLIAAATLLFLRGQRRGEWLGWEALAAFGCAGLAATIDLAGGGLFLLAFVGWAASVPALRRRWVWALAAGFGAAALHSVLNWQITGDPIPVLVRPEYILQGSATLRREELSGFFNHASLGGALTYAVGLLLAGPNDPHGPRGILLFSAPLFFAALAACRLVARREHPLRWPAIWLGGAGLVYLVYLTLFTNNYSGDCYGIRWSVVLLPAGYVLLLGGWNLLSAGQRVCAGVGLVSSVPVSWVGLVLGAWQGGGWQLLARILAFGLPVVFLAGLILNFTPRPQRRRPPPVPKGET